MSAKQLFDHGDAAAAAYRLRIMFELTSDLVQEASTGIPVASEVDDSADDAFKWINAWTLKGHQCNVNLSAKDWQPYLQNYAHYWLQANQPARANKVIQSLQAWRANPDS